jgi:hypothetical protein
MKTDPEHANLVVDEKESEELIPVGTIDDQFLLQHPQEPKVFHIECDPGGVPWKRLATVLPKDQRYCWEK